MVNYDDVLDQLRGAGLLVQHLEADGKMHRCRVDGQDRENRGWYVLHEWRGNDGELYVVGSYGVWLGNDNGATKVKLKGVQVSDAEKAAMRARMAEDRKRAAADRKREAEAAARRAEGAWRKALTTPPADGAVDYLHRKGVESYGLRYTGSGAMVIPMLDARGTIHGLQFILPAQHPRRRKTGRDKEYWPAGLQKQGHWFQIGAVAHGGVCLVAEGYATAATLHAATGLPVAVAFDAGNLRHVAAAIKKARNTSKILICADDDYLQKCRACRQPTPVAEEACQHCGEPHGAENAGVREAAAAAVQVGGARVAPVFPADRGGKKLTDFNDLQHFEGAGLPMVRAQIERVIDDLGWRVAPSRAGPTPEGGGESGRMVSRLSIADAVSRYWGTYGFGGEVLFDQVERRLVAKKDVMNLLPRHGWDTLKDHPAWRVALDTEVGFDPTEKDAAVRCNLFGGWPMEPAPGKCTALLSLLEYLCSGEQNSAIVYQWMLKWLAYPLQHPGAKMHSAIVVHGAQGTGKSRFFEAYARIFGPYGRVLGQEALEDKFNADWAQAKLFILADEVLARQELYHIKNRLKGFITGDTIRVNPKNIAAHNEKNQMNLVFLSNERQPLVLENDDRRHLVIWVPPKPGDSFFNEVNAEIENGGVTALYQHLLDLDLGDFRPWTRPPMTGAKEDLITLGLSNEERFVREWRALELEGADGEVLPFCPCLGSHLYHVYSLWCERNGERKRKAQDVIGFLKKLPGWQAGMPQRTHPSLRETDAATYVNRKLVVPSENAMLESAALNATVQRPLLQDQGETKSRWATRCFFAFERAVGFPS